MTPFCHSVMASSSTTPSSRPTQMWAEVMERLEAFASAWEDASGPPNPADFVPAGPADVRRLVLVEIVKFDIDCRLRKDQPLALEDYLRLFPELASGDGPPCDLLYEDFHLRCQAGHAPKPSDYFARFPGRAAELGRLIGGTASPRSTAVLSARVPVGVIPGEQLDDFDLVALLGEGQFAKVFLARQRSMQRMVALKVSAVRGAEAQTLARLDHPNIVRVYDQRTLPARGLLLVYMPYLAGGTLQDVIRQVREISLVDRSGRNLLKAVDSALERRGELPPADSSARNRWTERSWQAAVCAIGAKLAGALDYAHRHDVLHRDVKPANVLLSSEGEPLLADFNVGCCSKLEGAGPAAFFGGSLAYMAPEHLEAFNPEHPRPPESLDGRADIFGLAVTLWELFAGERPFGADHLSGGWGETLRALAAERRAGLSPDAISALTDGDVPGLKETLLRCLAPNPDDRPATAGEMAAELELCLRPATRALVRPAPGGWREMVRRHPLLAIYIPTIAVNLLASLFNIYYNGKEIVEHWTHAEKPFERIVPIINGIFFPLAMILFAFAIWPIGRALQQIRIGTPPGKADLAHLRQRSLRLGTITAGVCAGCWILAGFLWPVAIRVAAGPPPDGPSVYVHFLLSLAICGLIAAIYPYFLVTFLAVRVFYPSLLNATSPTRADGPALSRVERDLSRYRAATAGVPLLAVALLAFRDSSSLYPVAALGLAGLVGVALAYVIEGLTRVALTALSDLASTKA